MSYTPGPFLQTHMLLVWGGEVNGGETWQNSIRLADSLGGPISEGPILASMAGYVTACTAFFGRTATHISPRATMTFVKLNKIGIDGLYADPVSHETAVTPVGGGSAYGNDFPNQVAWVVSWKTAFARGPAHAGRIYLPLPDVPVRSDGLCDPLDATACEGSAATFLADLAAVVSGVAPFCMSRKLGAPAMNVITGARVGRVLDTQRRRRRSLREQYTL